MTFQAFIYRKCVLHYSKTVLPSENQGHHLINLLFKEKTFSIILLVCLVY